MAELNVAERGRLPTDASPLLTLPRYRLASISFRTEAFRTCLPCPMPNDSQLLLTVPPRSGKGKLRSSLCYLRRPASTGLLVQFHRQGSDLDAALRTVS